MRRIAEVCLLLGTALLQVSGLCQEVPVPDKDASWKKVMNLKSGTELRIFKVNHSTQPVLAKMDEATLERLLVVSGNAQVAIPRTEIERLDYRPSPLQPSSRVKVEPEAKNVPPDTKGQSPGRLGSNSPRDSYQAGSKLSFGGNKLPFEMLYSRPH